MKFALFLHLACISAWLGCILVEGVYEHSIDKSPEMRTFIADLHSNTDKYVEIPTFTGVFLTGLYMLPQVEITQLLLVKIGFGLLAILFNVICVGLVARRLKCARKCDFKTFEIIDRKQHQYGAVVLITLLIAFGLGGYAFVET